MNSTTATIALLTLLAFTGCKKDDDKPDTPTVAACESGNFGFITISCTSTNPYEIRVDNVIYDTVPGNNILQDMQLLQGNGRHLKATQVSGFILFPTVVESSFNVIRCSHYSWQIP